jgi:hypothetical protein
LYTNEPLDAATIPGAVFVSQNGVLVRGTTTVTGEGQVIEFVPEVPWAHAALIQVFVTPMAQDRMGNTLLDYQGSFRTVADTRSTAPVVVRTHPAASVAGVPRNVVLEVEFNEPLDPSTVNANTVVLRQSVSGPPVLASNLHLEREGRVVRLTPNALLAANTSHVYDLTTGIRDQDGQALPSLRRFFFTTGNSADSLPPSVVAVTPPDGAADIGVNANIRVYFSEPINPLTVTEGTMLLSDESGTILPCSIEFDNNNQDVVLVPHAPLAGATRCRLTVQGVEDRAGNAVIPQTTQFTTGAAPDTVAPVVVQVDPFNGATEVPVNVVITVEMDEPIDLGSVDSNSCSVYDDAMGEFVAGSCAVSADGRMVSFVPEAPLLAGSRYAVYFSCDSQRILDLAGNPLAGCFSTSFTTGTVIDTTGPQAVEVSPADDLAEVPINARAMIAFDEPIQARSVDQVTLHDGAGEVEVIRRLSNGNRLLTLLPVAPLAPRTAHTVTIAGVEDLAGNPLTTLVTTFTTETGADLLPPQVVAVDPADGAVQVPTNAVIQLTFSERINPLTVTKTTFQVYDDTTGLPVAGSVTVAVDSLSATFTPSSELAASTTYSVQAANLTDLAGLATSVFTYFSTGAP